MKSWPSLAPFAQTLSMPGGNLFYYDSDADAAEKPAIILIHGLGDEADTWRHVFPLLAGTGFRIIAPDLPGFGRSLWKGKISLYSQRDAIILLIEKTGAASKMPAALAGSSLGAGIAELTAFKKPDWIKALILIDGCFPFPNKVELGFFLLSLPFAGRKWYRGFRKNHEAAWKSLYLYYGSLDAMNSEDREFLRERVIARVESSNQENGYFSTVRSMNNYLIFGRRAAVRNIKNYPGKISLIWGDKDRIFPQEKAALFRRLRPDADFAIIADAGHLPHQEQPRETAEKIIRFCNN